MMIPLTTEAKEAIKVAVAIVIGYYVALRLDWSHASWVASSIAFISMPTAGQSMQKSFLRMGGTLLAFVAGLFYLGLFPQDRWLFLLSFTPYLFFVSYMVQGRNGQYFWFVAGFVTLMITTAGPSSSEAAFHFAAYRTLETMMGIGIWTVVSVYLWPRSNLATLKKTAHELLLAKRSLMQNYRSRVCEGKEEEASQPLRAKAGKVLTKLEQTISAAASENYAVNEVRPYWRRLVALSQEVVEILDRLDAGSAEMSGSDLRAVILNEEALLEELEARLDEAGRVAQGEAPGRKLEEVVIRIDPELFESLDHFQRAAVEVTKSELEELDGLIRGIVACLDEIEGYPARSASPDVASRKTSRTGRFAFPTLDPDRIRGAFAVVVSMWAGFLIWIYVDPPGHRGWYQFVPSLVLAAIQVPFMRLNFLKPFFLAFVGALLAYVFLMPKLTTFWELGLLLLVVSFLTAYFFKGLARVGLFLSMFLILGIQNQQSYDFAATANTFLYVMMALLLVTASTYVLGSPRPEKVFLRMLGRFFRSSDFLLSRLSEAHLQTGSRVEKIRRAYHFREIHSLPGKLMRWGRQIDPKVVPGVDPEDISAMLASLQILAYRMDDLTEARRAPHAKLFIDELTQDVRAWRIALQEHCRRWSERPGDDRQDSLRDQLQTRLTALDTRIESVLTSDTEGRVTAEERGNLYRLLGSFRSFSEAALVFAGSAEEIAWDRLREERFS